MCKGNKKVNRKHQISIKKTPKKASKNLVNSKENIKFVD